MPEPHSGWDDGRCHNTTNPLRTNFPNASVTVMAAALPFHRCSCALDAFVLARQIPSDVPLMRRVGSSLMAPPSVSGGGTKVSERQHVNTQVDGERTERRHMHYSSSILALAHGGSSAPVGRESHGGAEHATRVLV